MLVALGVPPGEIRKGTDNWLHCRCPMARWTHGKGRDSHPSFTVSIQRNATSFYNCFGCSEKPAPTFSLTQKYYRVSGEFPHRAAAIIFEHEIEGNKKKKQRTEEDDYEERPDPIPDIVLREYPILSTAKSFDAWSCMEYLISRGIRTETIRRYRIRFDPESAGIVFPYTTPTGEIMSLSVRLRPQKRHFYVTGKLAGYPEIKLPKLSESGAWFGLHLIDQKKPILTCEGEIDCMRLASLGFRNAVASGGTSISPSQISEITAPVVYLGFDSDKAGERATKHLIKALYEKCDLYRLDWSYIQCKDAGDLLDQELLKKVLRNKKRV